MQLFGASIENDAIILNVKFFNWHRYGLSGLKVGKESFIGDDTLFDLYDGIIIKNKVTIAQRVTILTHTNVGYKDHPLQNKFPKKIKQVVVNSGSVIGAGAIILPGVEIGKESFVAAGAIVTKNVPDNSLVGGNPAKLIRKIK